MADDPNQLLEDAMAIEEDGNIAESIALYNRVIDIAPDWSVPHYNLGLLFKYQHDWEQSFFHNQKAVTLSPDDESGWWNLGIAATALKDWRTARQAWNYFGLDLEVSDEEPNLNLSRAPVRLNPDNGGEVVWCTRIDPARAIIDNIPLASCGHRYNDIVLNDGAAVGYRISDGIEYPVFNELQLLNKSKYRTYSTTVYTNRQENIDKLIVLCNDADIQVEDWSTLRTLCKQCSEGTPHGQHDYGLKDENADDRYISFASVTSGPIQKVLDNWRAITLCEHSKIILELE